VDSTSVQMVAYQTRRFFFFSNETNFVFELSKQKKYLRIKRNIFNNNKKKEPNHTIFKITVIIKYFIILTRCQGQTIIAKQKYKGLNVEIYNKRLLI
jgi:hypothetical protein